jgi:phosphonate transport system permease protein
VAVAGVSFYLAGFSPEHFGEANTMRNMLRFCRGMIPPDFAKEFVFSLGPLLMQTLAISVIGTCMGVVIGGFLAIPATSTLVLAPPDSPGARSQTERGLRLTVFWAARLALNLLRSIPDLVWVLICILVVGIGPFAGTLSLIYLITLITSIAICTCSSGRCSKRAISLGCRSSTSFKWSWTMLHATPPFPPP